MTKTWKKQFPMRQPSAVNGVSGQMTWRVSASVRVRQRISTITTRPREESRLETAFASTAAETMAL